MDQGRPSDTNKPPWTAMTTKVPPPPEHRMSLLASYLFRVLPGRGV